MPPVRLERCRSAKLPNSALRARHRCAHQLCVPQRICYKLSVLTYRAINGTAPGYLQSCFTRLAVMSSIQRLRSSVSHRLAIPPVRLCTVGRRAFPVSGTNTRNDLLSHVTRGLQTAPRHISAFLFLPGHCHLTNILLFVTVVDLAIIYVI